MTPPSAPIPGVLSSLQNQDAEANVSKRNMFLPQVTILGNLYQGFREGWDTMDITSFPVITRNSLWTSYSTSSFTPSQAFHLLPQPNLIPEQSYIGGQLHRSHKPFWPLLLNSQRNGRGQWIKGKYSYCWSIEI